ncbi:MAG: Mur ligase family protein [Leptospirales bacterium]
MKNLSFVNSPGSPSAEDDFYQFYKSRNFEQSRRFGAGYSYSLRPVAEILKALDSPDNHYKTVHIAGTLAKGSVSTYLSRMMTSSGEKTGLYTSPHLTSLYERVVTDSELISEADFTSAWERVRKVDTKNRLSFYDALTLIAILFFKDKKVEWAVFETGLGGRLDSTNVLSPQFSVITKIGIDHENILGKGLENIAREKAGILKEGIVAYSMQQSSEVKQVLLKTAEDKKTHIEFFDCDKEQYADYRMYNLDFCKWVYKKHFNREAAFIPVDLSGRLETICTKPEIIFDSAHNKMAADQLYQWVKTQPGTWSIYCNTMQERDLSEILSPFLQSKEFENRIYILNGQFSADALHREIPKKLKDKIIEIGDEKSLWQAWSMNKSHLVFGSMYLYAAMKDAIRKYL